MKKKSLLKDDGFPDLNKDGEVTYADVLEGRGAFAVGGSLLADDMPVEEQPRITIPIRQHDVVA